MSVVNKNKPDYKMLAGLSFAEKYRMPVFPVKGKFPHKGSNGCKDASDRPHVIREMWQQHRYSNIAARTGGPSGVFVVDIDNKPDKGIDGLASLIKKYGDMVVIDPANQLVCVTPSGGMHLYFRTDGQKIKTRQGIMPGVDVRGDGGYVVVPPSSLNVNGKWEKYWFCNKDAPIPPTPEWVFDLLNCDSEFTNAWDSQRQNKDTNVTEDKSLQGFPQGQRDEGLFRFACRLRAFNVDIETALALITQSAKACQPPFDEVSARKKVEYVYETYSAGSYTQKGLSKSGIAFSEAIQKMITKGGAK